MKELDIELLQLSLKRNINLLKCFDEFCDESILPEKATQQEKDINDLLFTSRLSNKRSLLEASIYGLESNFNMLEDFLNNKSKNGVQRNG